MSESSTDRAEAAATRRRWITLAEVVAVAGVVIGGLSLYGNWSDRRADLADKSATAAVTARERSRIEVAAGVEDGGRRLALSDERHDIRDVAVAFPKALGVATQQPAGDPVIDARWFADALLAATDGGADDREGRLPVMLTISYWDGDVQRSTTGIYDVVWRTEGRMLRGRALKLEGLRLRERGGTQARLDALWRAPG